MQLVSLFTDGETEAQRLNKWVKVGGWEPQLVHLR